MKLGRAHHRLAPGLALALVLLALMVNVFVPQGYMPGAPGEAGVVVCTGHGPMQMSGSAAARKDPGSPGHSKTSSCAFADHGLANAPPLIASLFSSPARPIRLRNTTVAFLAPGLGLAAPPPPSHAPPVVIL